MGVLVTHSENYMFYNTGDNSNYKKQKEADTFYMVCSMKGKVGCNARATVNKVRIPGEDGQEDTFEYKLKEVATVEVSDLVIRWKIFL